MYEWQMGRITALENLLHIMRVTPQNQQCFHIHGSFGDVYIQLSVIKEILALLGKRVTLIIDERYRRLIELSLGGRCDVIFFNAQAMNNVFNMVGFVGTSSSLPIRFLSTLYPIITELITSRRLYYSDFVRQVAGSTVVGPFAALEEPSSNHINEALDLIRTTGVSPGRAVLISADNNTQVEFEKNFWDHIIEVLIKIGLSPVINDSGTLSADGSVLFSGSSLPKIKVPPHLAVAACSAAGGYVGGTNGFQTIQALFNRDTCGIHFINGFGADKSGIPDKAGNYVRVDTFFHSKAFAKEFLGTQTEFIVDLKTSKRELEDLLVRVFVR
ncbi:hypothetical protein MCEMSEM52_00547 [Burkholderiales bacterium]|jgi:hypothetical protein